MTDGKTVELFFICFSLFHAFAAALNCTSPTPESLFDALDKELFSKKRIRPVKNFLNPLNVSIDITIVGIIGVEEKEQSLTLFLWQTLIWQIDGLTWDENECGTKRVSVLAEDLWLPDITILEFMDEDKSPKTPYLYLHNTGRVVHDNPIRAVCSCQLEIYTFPFDVQNCTLTFTSYLHYAQDVRMSQETTAAQVLKQSRDVILTRGEWELLNIEAVLHTLELGSVTYSEVKYHVILRRKPMLFVVNLMIPSCFLVTVDLFSFLLPPRSVDRSAFKMTLILGYTVFLLIMNDLLPVTGNTTPLLNVFFSISLALMVFSLLETLFITNITFNRTKYSKVPHWLSVFMLDYVAVLVCLPPKPRTITVSPHPPNMGMNLTTISRDLQSNFGETPQKLPPADPILIELRRLARDLMAIRLQMENPLIPEYEMIGRVIDRLLFGVYLVFIVISFITIAIFWTNHEHHEEET